MPYQNPKYIGDGVYISHDGQGQLWIAVGNHENDVVALNESVFAILVEEYTQRVDHPQTFQHRTNVAEWFRGLATKLESHET